MGWSINLIVLDNFSEVEEVPLIGSFHEFIISLLGFLFELGILLVLAFIASSGETGYALLVVQETDMVRIVSVLSLFSTGPFLDPLRKVHPDQSGSLSICCCVDPGCWVTFTFQGIGGMLAQRNRKCHRIWKMRAVLYSILLLNGCKKAELRVARESEAEQR